MLRQRRVCRRRQDKRSAPASASAQRRAERNALTRRVSCGVSGAPQMTHAVRRDAMIRLRWRAMARAQTAIPARCALRRDAAPPRRAASVADFL